MAYTRIHPLAAGDEITRLLVTFPYDPKKVEKIKTIPGRIYRNRCWEVPATEETVRRLIELFDDLEVAPFIATGKLRERIRKLLGIS